MFISIGQEKFQFYKNNIIVLQEKWPAIFNRNFPLPLAVGIFHEIRPHVDFTDEQLSVMLRVWVHRFEYYAMAQSTHHRVHLDGSMEPMTEEHKDAFVAAHKHLPPHLVKDFSKRFYNQFGLVPFIHVPINQRKVIW